MCWANITSASLWSPAFGAAFAEVVADAPCASEFPAPESPPLQPAITSAATAPPHNTTARFHITIDPFRRYLYLYPLWVYAGNYAVRHQRHRPARNHPGHQRDVVCVLCGAGRKEAQRYGWRGRD